MPQDVSGWFLIEGDGYQSRSPVCGMQEIAPQTVVQAGAAVMRINAHFLPMLVVARAVTRDTAKVLRDVPAPASKHGPTSFGGTGSPLFDVHRYRAGFVSNW